VVAAGPPTKETTMRRTLTTLTPLLALLVAVGTAGCSRPSDPTVATLHSGSPQASAGAGADGEDSMLKFSQCMRGQGLTWFPDPGPDGGLTVHNPEGINQSTDDKAEQACKAYYPGANQKGTLSEADLNKLRQVSQCIRDHGFSKYPDPDAKGSIQIDEKSTGIAPDDPAFVKAMQECQKYLPPRTKPRNS
jgi:hypothetical protein